MCSEQLLSPGQSAAASDSITASCSVVNCIADSHQHNVAVMVGPRSRSTYFPVALLFLVSGGCLNPNYTRYPSLTTFLPQAENIAYQRQDPFPDPDIGPSLMSTPRGYERPRSTARRAAEQRLLQGLPVGPENSPSGVPRGGLSRPQAVH